MIAHIMQGDERRSLGVLHGIRILDLTRNVAGPYCTMILGDLGAEVVKVERPDGGDDTREWRPPQWNGISTTYLGLNRNKKSLAVDLDRPEGQQIVQQLAFRSDVLVESFRPGSLGRRGLGHEDVRAKNPRLVYCSISGFGSRGPNRDRPAYDPLLQAHAGLISITGEPDRPPVRVGPSIIDQGTGMWSALAILGALYARDRSGHGCLIEASLLETGVAWVAYQLVGYFGSGRVPEPMGSSVAMIAPYEAFKTKEGYLFLAAPNDILFARLCAVLGQSSLVDNPRFASNANRVEHRVELHGILEDALAGRDAASWVPLLLNQDVPCGVVQSLNQVADDAQVKELNLLVNVPNPFIPDLRLVDQPFSIDGSRAARFDPPPDVGADTDTVLQELGYDPSRIEQLRAAGVIR